MALPNLPGDQEQEQVNPALEIAKMKAKKSLKRKAMKFAKALAKKATLMLKKSMIKLAAGLVKLAIILLNTIGLPVSIIIGAIIVIIIIVSLVCSYFWSTGDGLEGEEKDIHDYIVEQSDATVDMSKPEQIPYKVPVDLLTAFIQIEALKNEDYKSVIKEMAEKLAPSFEYGSYNEYKETQVTTCRDGDCRTGKIKRNDNWVSKLEFVDYWSGSKSIDYSAYVTDWKTKVDIKYETKKWTEKVDYVEQEKYTVIESNTIKKTRKVPYEETIYEPYLDKGVTKWRPKNVTKYKDETYYVKDNVPITKTRDVKKTKSVEKSKKVEVKTITKTRYQKFNANESVKEDYSTLESILNSYDLSLEDKKYLEANYAFLGGKIHYTDWLQQNYGGSFGDYGTGDFGSFDGTIIPGEGVPPQYMPVYRGAEAKYGVPWYILAGIHFVETNFSTSPSMVSSVGAIGHTQVRP
ncbi:lysozyme family protein [Bacillus swezeyi]|uniref:Uncharacterized protein n=1 Tax=Bacillus swezeyi TaxID=1925020 RepID=A0A5M8RFK1_9BACI|nr:hypothetical protein [Bacillus swezeyi]KAA6446989.1 hypothetical protein DX927_23380 [Bacillus swezeyi]KAA6471557.1 hypothetical protein DX928_23620 [Bacillus swezeyi]